MVTIKTGDTFSSGIACFLLTMPNDDWFKQAIMSVLLESAKFQSWMKFGTIEINDAVERANEMIEGILIFPFNPLPVGKIEAYGGVTIPDGWLLCDGSSYATVDYPELFAALDYTWGGSGANFNVPDYVDKTIVGAGGLYDLGTSGGDIEITLDTTQIPSHDHSANDAGHTHEEIAAVPIAILEGEIPFPGASVPSPSLTGIGFANISIGLTGGGLPHSNIQPYGAANIMIFAGR